MGSRSTDALRTGPRLTSHEVFRRDQRLAWARVVRLHGLKEVDDLQRRCQVERRHRAQVLHGQVKVWGVLNAADRS